jgi:hypothetical protein
VLRNLLKPLEPAAKLAAAQVRAAPRLAEFAKAVAEGKIPLDKAVPVANKIVRDITLLHGSVQKYHAAFGALPKGMVEIVMHAKAFEGGAKEFLAAWERGKGKLKPLSATGG